MWSVGATHEVCFMAEDKAPKEVNSLTVIGIGVVLFVVIIGIWFLFLR